MVVGAQDFRFIGGSFGAASGELIRGANAQLKIKCHMYSLVVQEAKE